MDQQISAPERVRAALKTAGIAARIQEFATSTRTAQEAADSIGVHVGQIVKSLLFLAGRVPVLALVSGTNRVDLARLESLTGAAIRKADANAVRDATGFAIGGVPPTGLSRAIRTFIDRDLLQYDVVWAAAGTPRHVFPVGPQDLVRITAGAIVDLKLA